MRPLPLLWSHPRDPPAAPGLLGSRNAESGREPPRGVENVTRRLPSLRRWTRTTRSVRSAWSGAEQTLSRPFLPGSDQLWTLSPKGSFDAPRRRHRLEHAGSSFLTGLTRVETGIATWRSPGSTTNSTHPGTSSPAGSVIASTTRGARSVRRRANPGGRGRGPCRRARRRRRGSPARGAMLGETPVDGVYTVRMSSVEPTHRVRCS